VHCLLLVTSTSIRFGLAALSRDELNAHTEPTNRGHIFVRDSCCYLFTANGLSQALFLSTACIPRIAFLPLL